MPFPLDARRCAAAVGLVVLVAVSAFGLLARHEPPLAVGADRATRLALQDPDVRKLAVGATHINVLRVDDDLVKVTFFRGGRILAWVGVQRDGTIFQPAIYGRHRVGYGAPMSHAPVLLAVSAILFLLATLRGRLRRRRTLDAVVLAAFVVPTVLIDRAYMLPAQASAALLLLYLVAAGVIGAWRGHDDEDDAPSLLERLAARLAAPRLLTQIGLALLVVTVGVTATSTGIVDVAQANMEGATLLLHGILPYGNMPGDVVHGDTYGLPMYAIYAPFAAVWPMHDSWDEPTGSLIVGALAVLVLAAGFERATRGGRWPALIAVLTLPAGLMSVSSGTNDVLVAAALVWALAWFARPAASSAVLAMAGLAKVAPLVLLPLWLARLRGAELVRAVAACAAAGAIVLTALVALGGLHGPLDMVDAMAFQLSRRSEMSLWTVLDVQALQPVAQGLTLAVALGGAVLVALDRAVAADPRRVASLVTAVLAGLQLSANHWMPLYLLWIVPPAMVALLGPLGVRVSAPARSSSVSAGRPPRPGCPSSTPSWAR